MQELVSSISELMSGDKINLAITGALMGAGGSLGYFFLNSIKAVPLKIYAFIKRRVMTRITVRSDETLYYRLIDFISKKLNANNAIEYRVTTNSGRDSYNHSDKNDDKYNMGFFQSSNYLIWYKKCPLLINVTVSPEKRLDTKPYEIITITKFGKNKQIFNELFNDSDELAKKPEYEGFDIYSSEFRNWHKIKENVIYNTNNFIAEEDKLNKLNNCIEKFDCSEKEYQKYNINYNLGILLYGPPGTGKSSAAKYLAAKYNKNLYYLSLKDNETEDIERYMQGITDNSIVCIEDFDVGNITIDRDIKSDTKASNLHQVLNILDGYNSPHGCIFFLTTNEIEAVDRAIKRPGRIDLMLELSYLNEYTTLKMLEKFDIKEEQYSKEILLDYIINNNITPAKLENVLTYQIKSNKDIDFIKLLEQEH